MATLTTNDRRHMPERRARRSEGHGLRMSALDYIAVALLVIGGLNWASVALFSFDFVAILFGILSPATRMAYLLFGIAALYMIYLTSRWAAAWRD